MQSCTNEKPFIPPPVPSRRVTLTHRSCDPRCEQRGTPFIVAVNCFDGSRRFPPAAITAALNLDADVPVVLCDARQRASCRDVLVALVEHAIRLLSVGSGVVSSAR